MDLVITHKMTHVKFALHFFGALPLYGSLHHLGSIDRLGSLFHFGAINCTGSLTHSGSLLLGGSLHFPGAFNRSGSFVAMVHSKVLTRSTWLVLLSGMARSYFLFRSLFLA